MMRRHALLVLGLLIALAPSLAAQDSIAAKPRLRGSAFGTPLASFFVPGLGQYMQGAWLEGLAFTGAGAGGYVLYANNDLGTVGDDLPRTGEGQRAFLGSQLLFDVGGLSAYDAFHRALPGLQAAGSYDFVTAHDSPGSLLLAPFDLRMLKRWTTLLNLAFTGAITAILVSQETEPNAQYLPFRNHDGAFTGAVSLNAAVGEEALFRGWLYPVLYQNVGRRFWLANGLQAGAFGALHAGKASEFALVIGASAYYDGWVTKRNGWSIRESVFNHFWYDVAVISATLATQKTATVAVSVPVRF